jgi:hypothetical protein
MLAKVNFLMQVTSSFPSLEILSFPYYCGKEKDLLMQPQRLYKTQISFYSHAI